jgi:hypothetical protein
MFIIPYFVKNELESISEFKIWNAWVFLASGGSAVWETDEDCGESEIVDIYLKPNGFVGRVTSVTANCLYYELNPSAMDMKNYYMWSDSFDSEANVFRPFIWLGAANPFDPSTSLRDQWGWFEECEMISLGKYGNAADLWTGLTGLTGLHTKAEVVSKKKTKGKGKAVAGAVAART